MELKDIKAGEGLGDIKFGMTRSQVKKLLGEPSEIEKFSYSDSDEDLSESFHYDELELSAGFDEDAEWRLVTLAVSSPDYEFMNKKLIGIDRDSLLATLEELGIKNLEYENDPSEDSPESILITSKDKGITFWLEDNVVSEIQWGPIYINEETIIWPN